jgi:hypothetical protein
MLFLSCSSISLSSDVTEAVILGQRDSHGKDMGIFLSALRQDALEAGLAAIILGQPPFMAKGVGTEATEEQTV